MMSDNLGNKSHCLDYRFIIILLFLAACKFGFIVLLYDRLESTKSKFF